VRPESKTRLIRIEQVRDLLHLTHLKPTDARYKLGVLVAADRLKLEAANAFLKTLEEPPGNSILLLLSAAPDRLLETIRSRCLRLNFQNEQLVGDAAQKAWITGFAQSAAVSKTGLLPRYHLLGTLLARLSQLKAEVEEELTARSPLKRH